MLTGVEIRRKLEEFHPEGALFESAVRPVYRVLDDVLEELPASLAGAKRGALQQTAEFRPHGPRNSLEVNPFAFIHSLLSRSISQLVFLGSAGVT